MVNISRPFSPRACKVLQEFVSLCSSWDDCGCSFIDKVVCIFIHGMAG